LICLSRKVWITLDRQEPTKFARQGHLLIPKPNSIEIRCLVDETSERRGTHNEAQTASIRLSLKLIYFVTHHSHTIVVMSPHDASSRNGEILKATASM
jgi:hypothetical protein